MANTTDYTRLLDGYALLAIKDFINNKISKYVPINKGNVSYTGLGYYYNAGTAVNYVKITLPNLSYSWAMLTFEFTVRRNYNTKESGKLFVYGCWYSTVTNYQNFFINVPNELSAINVYSYGKDIYIGGLGSWCGITLDKVTCGDNVTGYDISGITLTAVSSLPTGYNTAEKHINSINGHTHTKSQITDFPTSMPANGGNSDTVDGYHAEQLLAFGNYKYHDIAAFCNASTPLYEVSADGSTGWTEAALNKDIFAAKENYSFQVTNTSQKGARFTWKGGISWSLISYCIIGWPWQQTGATVTLKFESSADSGATWRDLGTVTGITASSASALYSFGSPNGDAWFRLSIIQTSDTGTKAIATIKLLTSRWGDQGLGSEYEKPYVSDGDKTIRPWSNNTQLLGTSSYRWKEIHGITIYENGTALADKYLGKSAKAADSAKLNSQEASYYLNYNNLTNKPTIPSVSNATITIKQTGLSDQTFTLNGSAVTITLADTNTWRPLGTGASDACAGNDSRLSDARPASDVYAWAKASTKPSYTHNEIGAGVLTIGDGANRLMFRTNATYANGIYYSTPGNEALVFATKNSVTSWIFATTDPTQQSAWTGLTPSLQIKNGRVTINKLIAGGTDAAYNLDVNGTLNATTIYQNGSTLASTYLGISAKAADSSKLDGHALSYFITTDNIGSQSVYHAANSDYATDSGYASNSAALGGNGPAYYLNYNNFTNTPSAVLYTAQTLTDAQKTQARSNIGAGTSSFTGYTSSNKLHTDYINNAAGWTSVTESTVSGWGFTKNAGTVTSVKVGSTSYSPSSGVVSLPAYPTKSSWNYDDTYIKLSGSSAITGALILSTDAAKDLGSASKRWGNVHTVTTYATTFWAKGTNHYTTYGDQTIALGATNAPYATITLPNTTGTLALVGDNNHSHTLSIASGGSSPTTLAANTTYTLTAGGSTLVFKTPSSSGGYYANQYNETYYLTSNSGASLWAEDIQAGMAAVGLQGGNATMIGIGWPGLASGSFKRSLLFTGNRVDLTLADSDQNYLKGLSIDMYDDDYYTLHIRANTYSDLYGSIDSENTAPVCLHAALFQYEPSSVNSAVTYQKYVKLGVVMHNINYTYSSTVLLKINIRGESATESAASSYAGLCSLLYHAGHRSAATCLTCSGRYSSSSYVVLGVYATAYNSGLVLVYCSASSNTVNTLSMGSGTVTDTLSASLVP